MTQYSFMSLTYPGATNTFAFGINNTDEIVGYYQDAGGRDHGFTDQGGAFTSVDVAGAYATFVQGVNATGQIVGQYEDSTNFQLHGFIRDGGLTTTLDYPGVSNTSANAINASGQVVGTYTTSGFFARGFFYQGGGYTQLVYPNSTQTFVGGIDDIGDVGGAYTTSANALHGFATSGGALVAVDVPGAGGTQANALNNAGEIAGAYSVGQIFHGFTFDQSTYSPVDVSGATSTQVLGINDLGQIVGISTDSANLTTGFVATPLCFVAGTRICTARGDVAVEDLRVGDIAETATGRRRPVVWLGSRVLDGVSPEDWPVRIAASAFGGDLPERDLCLSPGHPVLVGAPGQEGSMLVPIMCLINGTSVVRMPVDTVTYWHVELDAHDLMLAEGLPVESFLDLCNRAWFEGGVDDRLANPDLVAPGRGRRCRPVAIDGPVVEAERFRLDGLFAQSLSSQCAWPAFDGAKWLQL